MNANNVTGLLRAGLAGAIVVLALGGCGKVSVGDLWPLGESGPREISRSPKDAVRYRCDDGKGFAVQPLAGGAMWLLAPDRDLRLDPLDGAKATRYGMGNVVLQIDGDAAQLNDPPATFSGCRRYVEPPKDKAPAAGTADGGRDAGQGEAKEPKEPSAGGG